MRKYTGTKGFIIFSVFRTENDPLVNIKHHSNVCRNLELRRLKYKVVVGVYFDNEESSILINAENEVLVDTLCRIHNQESYLYVDENRHSYLKYTLSYGTKEVYLGRWHETTKALAGDCYTITRDRYYKAS